MTTVPKKKRRVVNKPRGRFLLPGAGDGLVDPDFDDIQGIEQDLREHRGHSDQSEDYD